MKNIRKLKNECTKPHKFHLYRFKFEAPKDVGAFYIIYYAQKYI